MNAYHVLLLGAVVLACAAVFADPAFAACGRAACSTAEQACAQDKCACADCSCADCPANCGPAEQSKPQTRCPVMGRNINKGVFVDVNGYRVYLCCKGCAAAVEKDPDKYLAKIRENGEEPVSLAKVQPATIETSALAALVKSGIPLVLLDARTGKYDDGRRLPGAKQLGPKATAEEAAALIKAKDSLVVTYCANPKCPASGHLAARLKELGYTNVLEYPQGIEGWVKAGLSVEKAK